MLHPEKKTNIDKHRHDRAAVQGTFYCINVYSETIAKVYAFYEITIIYISFFQSSHNRNKICVINSESTVLFFGR